MESHSALLVAALLKFLLLNSGSVAVLPYCEDEIENVKKLKCYDNGIRDDNQVNSSALQWSIVDSQKGRIEVVFPLNHQVCNAYQATLYHCGYPNLKKECSSPPNSSNCKAHSYRTLSRITNRTAYTDELPLCSENGNVTFNFVYTGCYTLQVECEDVIGLRTQYQVYMETDYIKEDPHYGVTIEFVNKPNTLEGDIGISFDNIVEDTGLKVILMYHEDDVPDLCYKTGYPHSCCAIMNKEVECRGKILNGTNIYTPTCKLEKSAVKCKIYNVTDGYYCMMVEMYEDRCNAPVTSVWKSMNCHFHSKIGQVLTRSYPHVSVVVQPLSSEYIITGIVSSIFIVLCLGVLLYFRMRRTYIRRPDMELLDDNMSRVSGNQWMVAQSEVIKLDINYQNSKG